MFWHAFRFDVTLPWRNATFETFLSGFSQIASAVYTINGVPANMSSIVFQGKRSQTGITV